MRLTGCTLIAFASLTLSACSPPDAGKSGQRDVVDSNDRNSWQEQVTLEVPTGYVASVAFSPDGKMLATAIADKFHRKPGVVRLWDAATGRHRLSLKGFKAPVHCVAFSPDAKTLVTAGGSEPRNTGMWEELVLWEVATGEELRRLKGHTAPVWSVAFSPDGNTLASGSGDDSAKLWDLTTSERRTLNGHTSCVVSVAFSPDGKTLATGSDYTARLWDVETGTEKHTLRPKHGSVMEVVFSPDGKMLAVGGMRHLQLWDAATGELVGEFGGFRDRAAVICSLSFSLNGRVLAAGGYGGYKETGQFTRIRLPVLKVFSVATGDEIACLEGHTEHVSSVAFSPNGKMLATGSYDGTAKLWNVPAVEDLNIPNWQVRDVLRQDVNALRRGGVAHRYHRERVVLSVAFSPDGNKLAVGHFGPFVTLWDVTTGKVERVFRTDRGMGFEFKDVAFSADGKTLYARGRGDRVYVWDVASGKHLPGDSSPDDRFASQTLSPDGRTVAVVTGQQGGGNPTPTKFGAIVLQDSATGKEVVTLGRQLGAALCAAFDPNGGLLATGSGDAVLLWQAPRAMKDP